ncbi:uro-adherence factor A-like [Macrobrachium rosenbergii]|uniref:uro-adherence factor A-like n=1 Tax=Macrobrachium rosenbergii TaxID=79674 RepID=UPI0034D558F0
MEPQIQDSQPKDLTSASESPTNSPHPYRGDQVLLPGQRIHDSQGLHNVQVFSESQGTSCLQVLRPLMFCLQELHRAQGLSNHQGLSHPKEPHDSQKPHGSQGPSHSEGIRDSQKPHGSHGPSHSQGLRDSQKPHGSQGPSHSEGIRDSQKPHGSQGPSHSQGLSDLQERHGSQGPSHSQGPGTSQCCRHKSETNNKTLNDRFPSSKEQKKRRKKNDKTEYLMKMEQFRRQKLGGQELPKLDRKCNLCMVLCPCAREFERSRRKIDGVSHFVCDLCPVQCKELNVCVNIR